MQIVKATNLHVGYMPKCKLNSFALPVGSMTFRLLTLRHIDCIIHLGPTQWHDVLTIAVRRSDSQPG